jgi:hypothetical protein
MRKHCADGKSACWSKCLKIGLLAVIGIAALGWVVMLLWNWLLPELFPGVRSLGYLQALGVLLLSKILFGGFRGGCHGRWRERRERWESMSPEEREQLKGRLHGRWGRWCSSERHSGPASGSGERSASPDDKGAGAIRGE